MVADRLELVARAIDDPARITACTDCGFDTSAGMGRVAPSVVWAKLRAMATGAKLASGRLGAGRLGALFPAAHHVIVHKAHGLHERVADRWADETEPRLLQYRFESASAAGRLAWHIRHRLRLVDQRLAIDRVPDEPGKAARLLIHHLQPGLGVGDGGFDLQAIADDAAIRHQTINVSLIKLSDLDWIKIGEGRAEVIALPQDRDPGQASLKAFQA